MPELPEVETIARQLQEVLPGRVIQEIEVRREKSFKGAVERLSGSAIKRVSRRAKMIVVELENRITRVEKSDEDGRRGVENKEKKRINSDLTLVIHLKMTGQLIFDEKIQDTKAKIQTNTKRQGTTVNKKTARIVGGHPTPDWVGQLPSKHTRVVIDFSDGSKLFFNDMRVFGWIKVMTNDQLSIIKQKLPPDVIDREYTVEYLQNVLKRSQRAVKLVLMDQNKIGGLGNIYANDALYLAHTKPTRKANSLKKAEITLLHKTTKQVIQRGIETGGASESTYKHINGLGGKYQEEFAVYKRAGERCGLDGCDGVIKKIKLGGRGTYYCPQCQK